MTRKEAGPLVLRIIATLLCAGLLLWASVDVGMLAWGTGGVLGGFSLIWGAIFLGFVSSCIFFLGLVVLHFWFPGEYGKLAQMVASLRERLSLVRWSILVGVLLFPLWLFLRSRAGEILADPSFRFLFFLWTVAVASVLLTRSRTELIHWSSLMAAFLLVGTVIALGEAFRGVSDYPFSLTWSEGNRIWDYSVLYGRRLYNYRPGQTIESATDIGRLSLWGLPFLLPRTSIFGVRLWSAFLFTVPYALFGWMVFKYRRRNRLAWLLIGLWAFLLLYQGPIYTPLIVSAMLVAGGLRYSMWIALPLVALSAYYAQASRYTWVFAPALWVGMMTLGKAGLQEGRIRYRVWRDAIVLALVGASTGYAGSLTRDLSALEADRLISVEGVTEVVSRQPLLWYRLWPNATYGLGILLGLLLATGPLIALLIYLVKKRHWRLNLWQGVAVAGPLAAFLGVGLVVSAKIGGGSNLHNMDMFLIALVFTAALAWQKGADELVVHPERLAIGGRLLLILAVAMPAFQPMLKMNPLELPPVEKAEYALEVIRDEVARALDEGGEVLFMDQRQLLTFGYVQDVPLVPEYEKKRVMNEALSANAAYFEPLHQDLADHRFALIITEPIKLDYQEVSEDFSEENNAWVRWVSEPLLRHYEPRFELRAVDIWLMVPRSSE